MTLNGKLLTFISVLLLAGILPVGSSGLVQAAGPPVIPALRTDAVFTVGSRTVTVDGQAYTMDVAPCIDRHGRTLVPVRFLAEVLNMAAYWEPRDNKVDIEATAFSGIENLTIGSDKLLWTKAGQGGVIVMDAAPVILPPGRTMVPVACVARAMGYRVSWDPAVGTVTVTPPVSHPTAPVDLSFSNNVPSPNTRFSLSPFHPLPEMDNSAPQNVSISLTLPMYPNAQEDKGTNNQKPPEYPAASDLYEGASNAFLVPLDLQDAETWFSHQLTSLGYSQYGSGSFGNTRTGTSTDEYSFKKIDNPDVYITYDQNGTNNTIVQYFGEYIIPPPRPADSQLPNAIQEIDIGYSLLASSGTFTSKPMVIKDSSTINKLVSAVNQMTMDTATFRSCPAMTPDTQELTVKFLTSLGDTYTLTEFCGFTLSHNSNTYSLDDSNNTVLPLIEQIYGNS